ncbi:PQQ-binding-like beta-propeller repeat protein [Candidatus Peregrinibacteria bacterium]|nr:PQQ-binding-like beta-propeller repeat protein [Candidatus Peregrinibacteria bacterium]
MADWPSFRNNNLNNGVISLSEKPLVNDSPESFQTDGLIWSTPVIDELGFVYVGSADRYFYKLDENLNPVWRYEIDDSFDALIDSAALISRGLVIVPGGDGYLHALDKMTGNLKWKFKAAEATEEQVESGILVNSFEGNVTKGPNGLIYAGSDNGSMYALDHDGEKVWSFQTDMMIWSSPVFDPKGGWMAFGSLDGNLYLLDPDTGYLLDKKPLGEIKASPVYDPNQNLMFVGNSAGAMLALSVNDLKLKQEWVFETENEIYSSASYYDGKIYFGSADGYFYALNYNGKLDWKYPVNHAISSSPVVIRDMMVIFGAANGKLYALNLQGRKIWSYQTTENLHKANLDSSPAIAADGNIYVGSYNGNVYSLPVNYCSKVSSDSMCNFDMFSEKYSKQQKLLSLENEDGQLVEFLDSIGLSEPLKIKLVAFDDKGDYVSEAAINRMDLEVSISPEIDFTYYVSSDKQYIYIYPEKFWDENKEYAIVLKGNYYYKEDLFYDRLKWIFLPVFYESLSFRTDTSKKSEFDQLGSGFGVKNLSLYSPKSINTLVAAAVDAQRYLAKFENEGKSERLKLYPASENDGYYEPLDSSIREIDFDVEFKGNSFVATAYDQVLSGMGGLIPVSKAIVTGDVVDGEIENGTFFAISSCIDLKGNNDSYNFPLNLTNDACHLDLSFSLTLFLGFEAVNI